MKYTRFDSGSELGRALAHEVAKFELPPDWQEGREVIDGHAIDDPTSPDKDDAVTATHTENGVALHVSVTDAGTMLRDYPAIKVVAGLRKRSIYRASGIARSMIDPSISEDALSLLHNQLRPVVTATMPVVFGQGIPDVKLERKILHVTDISYDEVNASLNDIEPDPNLVRLSNMAFDLSRIRKSKFQGVDLGDAASNENDEMAHLTPAEVIVRESMIMANIGVAQFFVENNIPALFRVHSNGQRFARYSVDPDSHSALDVPLYMHFTSPIRRFADLIAHTNWSDWIDGRDFTYTHDKLRAFELRFNAGVIARMNAMQQSKPKKVKRPPGSPQESRKSVVRHAEVIKAKINSEPDNVGIEDLAAAIVGEMAGDPAVIESTRRLALDFLVTKPSFIKGTFGRAIHHGWIELDRTKEVLKYNHPKSNVLLHSKRIPGVAFPTTEAIAFLGDIIDYQPDLPALEAAMLREQQYRYEGHGRLSELKRRNRIMYETSYEMIGGEHVATVYVVADGIIYRSTSSHQSKDLARDDAAYCVAPYVEALPDPPEDVMNFRRSEQQTSHKVRLHEYLADQIEGEPAYETEEVISPFKHWMCTARIDMADGSIFSVEVAANSDRRAEETAAKQLFAQIQERSDVVA